MQQRTNHRRCRRKQPTAIDAAAGRLLRCRAWRWVQPIKSGSARMAALLPHLLPGEHLRTGSRCGVGTVGGRGFSHLGYSYASCTFRLSLFPQKWKEGRSNKFNNADLRGLHHCYRRRRAFSDRITTIKRQPDFYRSFENELPKVCSSISKF